jgi:hypothetical protein
MLGNTILGNELVASDISIYIYITGNISLPFIKISGIFVNSTLVSGDLVLPVLKINGNFVVIPVLTGKISLPKIKVFGQVIIGSSPLPLPEKLALVVNLKNYARSNYTNYDFDSFIEVDGRFYAAGLDGNIYILEGDDDDGTEIIMEFTTCTSDLGNPERKNVPRIYIGYTDEISGEPDVYSTLLPLGIVGRYWNFTVKSNGIKYKIIESVMIADIVSGKRV